MIINLQRSQLASFRFNSSDQSTNLSSMKKYNFSCIDRICRCVGNFVADNGKCTSSNRITVSSFGVTMQPILAEYTSNYVRSDLGYLLSKHQNLW